MLKKLRIILGLLFIAALCAGLAACKAEGDLDKYDVLVYYDANGGEYSSLSNVTVVDGFCFSDFTADDNGLYHFNLLEPTSSARPYVLSLTKTQSFRAGWYKTREVVKDEEGRILDSDGRILVEREDNDGNIVYYVTNEEGYLLDEEGNALVYREKYHDEDENKDYDAGYYIVGKNSKSTPAISEPFYTYDDRWDFENDELICDPEEGNLLDKDGNIIAKKSENGKYELRLYSGWVPYYYFYYYRQVDGEWVKYGETYFNYSIVEEENYTDRNTIWTPDWNEGAMDHKHPYKYSSTYEFPGLSGHTFVAAYNDEACTDKIEGSTTHNGSLDIEHAAPIDRIQNIYVVFEEGVKFRIETAEQLAKNVNLNGQYTILDNLQFSDGMEWPSAFITGEFNGTFTPEDNKTVTITGAVARFASTTATHGGLFGHIGANAVIKNINFVNVILDITTGANNRQDSSLGLFSGEIEDGATVENITVGGIVKLGKILRFDENSLNQCRVNLLVFGDNKNGVDLAASGIKLQVYCEDNSYGDNINYLFTVDPNATTVDNDGNVSFAFVDGSDDQYDEPIYEITTWTK